MLGAPPSTPATLTMTSGTGSSTFVGLRWIFIALLLARTCGRLSYITYDDTRRPPLRAWTAPGVPPATRLRPLPGVVVGRYRSGMIPPWENPRPSPASRASSRRPTWPTRGAADADVAILGIPYDEATTARPGARYGPRAMRDASTNWAYRDGATPFYDGEVGAPLLGGVRFVDSGDVDLPPTAQPERSHPLIGARVGRLLEHGLFPVVLGGDHSITYPILKAFGGTSAAPRAVRHPHGLLERRGRHAASRTPAPSSARTKAGSCSASPSTASAACTPTPTRSSWPASAA